MKKYLIVSIIYFNNSNEIINYLDSLLNKSNVPISQIYFSITVNSEDKNLIKLNDNLSLRKLNFLFHNPKTNIGYLNGLIQGTINLISYFNIRYDSIKNIIFSNTDLIFKQDFLDILYMKNYSDEISVIGPYIFSKLTKNSSNPSYKNRISKLKIKFLIIIFSTPLINFLYYFFSNYKNSFFKKNYEEGFYYQVHGAIFILNPTFFKILANFDTFPLLFSEESIISEISFLNNFRIFYDPSLKLSHEEHTSISKSKFSFIFKNYVISLIYVLKKFY